jgi:hypothetical protein
MNITRSAPPGLCDESVSSDSPLGDARTFIQDAVIRTACRIAQVANSYLVDHRPAEEKMSWRKR